MLFMELVRLAAPTSILQFFPVPLVLGVKDDGDVLQLQGEIRDKRALRPEIRRFPRERNDIGCSTSQRPMAERSAEIGGGQGERTCRHPIAST